MDIVTVAATAMSLVINGLPVAAYYVQGVREPCDMASAVAKEWRRQGKFAVESRVGEWCTVGMASNGEWIAHQWRSIRKSGIPVGVSQSRSYRSEGWRIHIPLSGLSHRPKQPVRVWDLDVIDRSIGTRIQFRQSRGALNSNAQLSAASPIAVKAFGNAGLWVDGLDPSGGHYVIAIQRGVLE